MTTGIEKEALRIARDKVQKSLEAQGHDLTEVGVDRINELANQILNSYQVLYDEAIIGLADKGVG